jgi:hypothetical protein
MGDLSGYWHRINTTRAALIINPHKRYDRFVIQFYSLQKSRSSHSQAEPNPYCPEHTLLGYEQEVGACIFSSILPKQKLLCLLGAEGMCCGNSNPRTSH